MVTVIRQNVIDKCNSFITFDFYLEDYLSNAMISNLHKTLLGKRDNYYEIASKNHRFISFTEEEEMLKIEKDIVEIRKQIIEEVEKEKQRLINISLKKEDISTKLRSFQWNRIYSISAIIISFIALCFSAYDAFVKREIDEMKIKTIIRDEIKDLKK